ERKTAYEYDMARDGLYDVSSIGSRAVKEAVDLHGAKKLDVTKTMTTIWHPKASATYIASSLGRSVVGQPVVEQISPLCDRIGDTVAPDFLTIIDDGQSPDSLGANAIDSEGHPQKVNSVIENGILKAFLFDTYFGRAHGVDSTGNCSRGGGFFGGSTPYEEGPSATTKTLKIAPGSKSFDDLIASIDEPAILITEFPIGIFHSSVATGEFSAVANSAFLVEKGEVQYPLQPCSVAGNFYEGYQNIKSIGSDLTVTYFGVNVPTIAFDGFSVVG
ncbi:MAG: metallopeptidase TldD-related protein, partial [Candidatus Thorarchaeota archaeon]